MHVTASESWTPDALGELQRMATRCELRTIEDEPLARHTSMGVGGACPMMLWPRTADDVRKLARFMGPRSLGWRVLGGGSNVLVADDGVAEVVLNTGELTDSTDSASGRGTFAAGTSIALANRNTTSRGLDGLVWTAGLPGTIGGAAAGNAGCWGGSMSQSVLHLDVVAADGEAHRLTSDELTWAYRSLALPATLSAPVTIVAVGVRLWQSDASALLAHYRELQQTKRQRQPVGTRSSGCVFRNPGGPESAGQLLERAGCAGLQVGGAQISNRHANFLVNRGGATARDVLELIDIARARVRQRLDVELHTEICQW